MSPNKERKKAISQPYDHRYNLASTASADSIDILLGGRGCHFVEC